MSDLIVHRLPRQPLWTSPGWARGGRVAVAVVGLPGPDQQVRSEVVVVGVATAAVVDRIAVPARDGVRYPPTPVLGWLDDHTVLVQTPGSDDEMVGSLLASDTRGRSFRLVSQLLDRDMALSVALP